MFFKDIVGQNQVKEHLIRTVKDGFIPHAQLFCGPEGVGGKFPLRLLMPNILIVSIRQRMIPAGNVLLVLNTNIWRIPICILFIR